LTHIKKLSITNCGLINIPDIKTLINLEYLDLSNNNIRSIYNISLPNLKELRIHNNDIRIM